MKNHEDSARDPKLGIIFLVNSQLFITSCRLAECEDCGGFKNYPGDHQYYWSELQKTRAVSSDSEYEEHPRGRAVLNRQTGRFSLYLDRCILSKRRLVTRIVSQLHLPADTVVATDPHYRCSKCLGITPTDFDLGESAGD